MGDDPSRKKLAQLVVGMLVGLGFGLVMSLVSNGFVSGVLWLTALRETHLVVWFGLDPGFTSMMPLICLLVAAFLILQVRKLFGIIALARACRQYFRGSPHRQRA